MPMVSVIMPCYNHGKYVAESIKSVLNQTYTDFEFIIVDNASTDNSNEVISSFHDERIKMFKLEKNDIEGANRLMVENSEGKYVAHMFSDDVWEPEKLEKQVAALENNPEYLISAAWSMMSDENLNPLNGEVFNYRNCDRLQWIRNLIENGNCLSSPTLVARRDLYEEIYDAYSGYWQLPDYVIWLKALMRTNIYVVEEHLVRQRYHESTTNISYPNPENMVRSREEQTQAVLAVLENISNDDFRQMYADKLIKANPETNIDIICEKYFVLLDLVKKNQDLGDIAIYYFLKYYSYEENGVHVADVMRDEYNYSYMDFRSVSGTMGHVAEEARLEAHIKVLYDKLISILSDGEVNRLREIDALLGSCLGILGSDAEENRVAYGRFTEAVEGLISMQDKLAALSDSAADDRRMLELCSKLGRIYEANQGIADVQVVAKQIVVCRDYIKRIFSIIGGNS